MSGQGSEPISWSIDKTSHSSDRGQGSAHLTVGRSWHYRLAISAVILAAISLQAATGSGALIKFFGVGRASAWPFIDYALFREAHYPGEMLTTWLIRAKARSGAEVELSPLGVDWVMGVKVHNLTNALVDGDRERVLRWCATYGEVSGDPLVSLELIETRFRLERDGFARLSSGSIGGLVLDPLPPVSEWPLSPARRQE